ncbi:hypothetical protein F5X96DRAFT_689959 [Biscogniauxia mediterranea]|nr:hypothetical protein F5X96DRAFT_689959 [Biscogniauxia mediterranea]
MSVWTMESASGPQAMAEPDPVVERQRYLQLDLREDVDIVGMELRGRYQNNIFEYLEYTPEIEDEIDLVPEDGEDYNDEDEDEDMADADKEDDLATIWANWQGENPDDTNNKNGPNNPHAPNKTKSDKKKDFDPAIIRRNKLCWGFSLEFAMATCRGRNSKTDPHPWETRWLPWYLGTPKLRPNGIRFLDEFDEKRWNLWVRDHIYETLQIAGEDTARIDDDTLWPGHKEKDESSFYDRLDFGILEAAENHKLICSFVDAFNGYGYDWDPQDTPATNRIKAWAQIREQFEEYLLANQVHPGWILYTTTLYIADNFRRPTFLRGDWPDATRDQLITIARGGLWPFTLLSQRLLDMYDRPLTAKAPVRKMRDKHRFASVGRSSDVLIDYLIDADYQRPGKDPNIVRRYKWFPGKFRSRTMDDDPTTFRSMRSTCVALRATYRIHKPLSTIGGTLCVHIGSVEFWTLTQLKKFATLWILAEKAIMKCCRKERGSEYTARPLGTHSRLAKYLELMRNRQGYAYSCEDIVELEWFRNRVYSEKRMDEFRAYVPIIFPDGDHIGELIQEIWQYRSINALREGLGDAKQLEDPENPGDMAVYFGMHGWKVTGDRPYDWNPETRDQSISIRLMHTTTNPRHIENWVNVLLSLAEVARGSINDYAWSVKHLWRGRGHIWQRIADITDEVDAMDYLITAFHPYGVDAEGLAGYLQYYDEDKGYWGSPFVSEGHGSEFFYRGVDDPDDD